MKKRIIAILLTGMMVLNSVPVYAEGNTSDVNVTYAEEVADSGEDVAVFAEATEGEDSTEEQSLADGFTDGDEFTDASSMGDVVQDAEIGSIEATDDLFLANEEVSEDAETIAKSGTLATGVKWELSQQGKLHFTGTGAIIKDDGSDDYPWEKSKVLSLEIENGITEDGIG